MHILLKSKFHVKRSHDYVSKNEWENYLKHNYEIINFLSEYNYNTLHTYTLEKKINQGVTHVNAI